MSYSEEGKGNSGWNVYNLDEVYDFSSGISKSSKEFGFGYPFVTFKDVFYNYFIPQKLIELANTTEKERVRCSVMRGDVFLTRTSETMDELGKSSVALKDYPEATFNGFTKRLRPNGKTEIHPEYAGYYFRSPRFRAEINSMATMTTRASLNNDMISRLKIVLPKIEIQKSIASILSSLDKKVELNNEMNKTLEEMAQVLFKRWFVDFEFPNEDGEPYKSSGGEMLESELGMIPKGWGLSSLDNIANYLNGLAMQKYRPESDEFIPVIKIKDLGNGRTDNSSDKASINIPKQYIINDGDVIFSWSGTLMVKIWTGGIGGLNQHLFKVTSEEYDKWYYYLWTNYHLGKFKAIAKDKATTMGHIKRSNLTEARVLVPDVDVYRRLNNIMKPIVDKIIEVNVQSKQLRELRDSLLPKLMSGEIRVEEVEANL